MKNFELISVLEENLAGEAEARQYYYELMEILPEEDHPVIKEILSDELNHSERLKELIFKYSGIAPAKD